MTSVLEYITYALILIFGVVVTAAFAGYEKTAKNRNAIVLLIFMIFLLQLAIFHFVGLSVTRKLYPLIVHLPVMLFIVLYLKKPLSIAFVSVLTAYLCCQPPNWLGIALRFFWDRKEVFFIANSAGLLIMLYLIKKYVASSVNQVMAYSRQSLILFGSFPFMYYLFDYTTTVYTEFLYTGSTMVVEFFPSVLSMFYIVFVMIYYNEIQKRSRLELDNAILATQSERAMNEIFALQQVQAQTAIYRHDMRHHLSLLYGFIEAGEADQAQAYIRQAQDNIDGITPVRYCENNTINLILSYFAEKSKQQGMSLEIDTVLPDRLGIPDTEICTLLSNGLQNAIEAASHEPRENPGSVRLNCRIHKGNLLLLIENTFHGQVEMKNGLPQTDEEGHGFGVKSIAMIVDKHKGYYSFSPGEDLFTLKVVLPLAGGKINDI